MRSRGASPPIGGGRGLSDGRILRGRSFPVSRLWRARWPAAGTGGEEPESVTVHLLVIESRPSRDLGSRLEDTFSVVNLLKRPSGFWESTRGPKRKAENTFSRWEGVFFSGLIKNTFSAIHSFATRIVLVIKSSF
jgi:hypothetical protein